jgi:hypothetical protein
MRRIQRQRARGDSLRKIADDLNQAGSSNGTEQRSVVPGDGAARVASHVVVVSSETLAPSRPPPPRSPAIGWGLLLGPRGLARKTRELVGDKIARFWFTLMQDQTEKMTDPPQSRSGLRR